LQVGFLQFGKRFGLPKALSKLNGAIVSLTIALLGLFLWQWKLMLALTAGGVAMVMAYQMQHQDWEAWNLGLQRWATGYQRILILSAASGIVATLGVYLAESVWVDSHNAWIALGFLFQGLGTLAVLLMLVVQNLSQAGERQESGVESAVEALSNPDPIQRLLALRRIDRFVSKRQLDSAQLKLLTGALQVLVKTEPEPSVRNAALDSLHTLRLPKMV
jgi:hypothetical protein